MQDSAVTDPEEYSRLMRDFAAELAAGAKPFTPQETLDEIQKQINHIGSMVFFKIAIYRATEWKGKFN